MKKLAKIALLTLCAGTFFAACENDGDEPMDMDPSEEQGDPDEGTEEDLIDDDFDEDLEEDLDEEE